MSDKNLIVSLAKENDIDQLVDIVSKYRAFYGIITNDESGVREFLKARMQGEDSKIFIATNVANSNILGFIQLYPSFSTVSLKPQWILNDFYVLESERNKGVGTQLMNNVIEHFKGSAKGFILVTEKSNSIAKRFYEKHNWSTDIYDFYTYSY